MKRTYRLSLLLMLLLSFSVIFFYAYLARQGDAVSATPPIDISGKVNAPELTGGLGWLNVARPLSLKDDLRGKVVLLDFWTYCCINCMHILPDLKKLEHKYKDELVVVGVHSAKFQNEKESENIRSAILRYEIEHPVVNDADFRIWSQYAVNAWPTLVVIDPDGKMVGRVSGEGQFHALDDIIGRLVNKYEGQLNREPIPLALERDREPETFLSFPGKIHAGGQRLFIADSNHNRIVIADPSGRVLDIAGEGSIGSRDGSFDEAQFNHPQGMVLVGELLYVADTENHLLRKLNLQNRTVETLAGTGVQGRWGEKGGKARETALNSPWDLTVRPNDPNLYIAMAGPHQIWMYRPDSQQVEPFAGSGFENIEDGPLSLCQLAQPSGITTDGVNLYFADSEVSALRMIDFAAKPKQVKTLIGSGLFDFGDQDGPFADAVLQHPLGVVWHDGQVYVADTYNHKIKRADLERKTLETLAGTGEPGLGTPAAPQFYEPGGLSLAGGNLYIADTNNHAVRVLDLQIRAVETLTLDESEYRLERQPQVFDLFGNPEPIALEQAISPQGTVRIRFDFPEGYHFNPQAQPMVQFQAQTSDGQTVVRPKFIPRVEGDAIEFSLSELKAENPAQVDIGVNFYYCRADNQGACRIGSARFRASVGEGKDRITLTHAIPEEAAR